MYGVILAEDEELLLKAVVATIDWESHGFRLAAAAKDGGEALARIRELEPDLVITDVRMPVMDGITLIRTVREELPEGKCPLFIILTAHGDFEYARQAVKLGVVDFLMKPLDDAELHASLDKAAGILDERAWKKRLEAASGMDEAFRSFTVPEFGGSGDPADAYVEKTVSWMSENYVRSLTVEEFAGKLGISSGYLSRIFSRKTGYTFYDYLAFLRIRKAIELLRDPVIRIQEVADRVGYSDQRYFSRKFREIVGRTPSEYREAGTR